jgi:arsenate reductase
MSETVIFGIENCDQVRKARRWLREHDIDARFHDVRRDGLDAATLRRWLETVAWDSLLNRRGQTWRALADAQRAAVVGADSAVAAMLAEPTLIKRPVVEADGRVLVGFSEPAFESFFQSPST